MTKAVETEGGGRHAAAVMALLRSSSIRAALMYGFGGIGFAVANLLLAGRLEPREYGLLALLLAVIQLGFGFGPGGMDLVIVRHRLTANALLAMRAVLTSGLVALLIMFAVRHLYGLQPDYLWILGAIVVASTLTKISSAIFQSRRRQGTALLLTQSHNYFLLLTLPIAIYFDQVHTLFFLLLILLGYCVTAVVGWVAARRIIAEPAMAVSRRTFWLESIAGIGAAMVVMVLSQVERLVIPLALPIEEMARYGVLAAVAVAPFRILQLSVGFTLLPRLREAQSRQRAAAIIRSESALMLGLYILGAGAAVAAGPWIIQWFVGNKYVIELPLFLAVVLVGFFRVAQALTASTANAFSSAASLNVTNGSAWVALGIGVAGAWALSSYGLIGVVYGVGLAWLWQTAVGLLLARRLIGRHFALQ